ncbi:Thioredoxin superfamily protein [Prunus dulcis]|uniref:Peroxiredoxin Q, chloroplastic n=1 Tax=Prunus dulcis TaxID=3755 RepID=A0A4Y1RBP9_PRUDU|nr:Thioredoxin superfamily protein [Prunus dulcis]
MIESDTCHKEKGEGPKEKVKKKVASIPPLAFAYATSPLLHSTSIAPKQTLPIFSPRHYPSSQSLPIVSSSSHSQFYGLKLSNSSSLPIPSSSSSGKMFICAAKVDKGKVPPAFTLNDHDGKTVSLSKFKGKPVVLYFYLLMRPRVHQTSFCKEIQTSIHILSDEGNKVRKEWGVPSDLFGTLPGRQTYVLDKNGVVQLIYNNQFQPEKLIDETLKFLQSL